MFAAAPLPGPDPFWLGGGDRGGRKDDGGAACGVLGSGAGREGEGGLLGGEAGLAFDLGISHEAVFALKCKLSGQFPTSVSLFKQ